MANLSNINKDSFETEVLKSNTPVVVDFWAEWCGPCKALAPVLEEISDEVGSNAKVVKVNVDEAGELAQQYGIRGIPTLIFFKDGEVKSTLVGNQPKAEILKTINDLM
ncbi:MAG: thioredoxin [Halobacteriovoraceae bacterium]|nr:thioredoxin [Halobacteriovoraceae bacterium]|tara:strand:+ start:788 stop:1111 length:324 start_codon:yes stop_codon:yes gene_type:complete